jgi:hypothetical protein
LGGGLWTRRGAKIIGTSVFLKVNGAFISVTTIGTAFIKTDEAFVYTINPDDRW